MSARHRVSKLLLAHGRVYDGKTTWNRAHRLWLGRQRFEQEPAELAFIDLLAAVDGLIARRGALDERLSRLAATPAGDLSHLSAPFSSADRRTGHVCNARWSPTHVVPTLWLWPLLTTRSGFRAARMRVSKPRLRAAIARSTRSPGSSWMSVCRSRSQITSGHERRWRAWRRSALA